MDVAVGLDASLARVAQHRDLPRNLLERPGGTSHRTSRVEARPEMPPHWILRAPPRIQRAEAILRRVHLPVELGSHIVEPPLTQPFPRIGVGLTEGIEAVDSLRIARTPDAEGADADRDPRLGDVHPLVELGHEVVDVVSAPVVAVGPVLLASVLDPRRMVREVEFADDLDRVAVAAPSHPAVARSRFAIGIEEVIEMHAIDVVPLHDVDDSRQYCLAGFGNAGIDPLLPAIAAHPVGMFARDMVASGANAPVERRTERVEPGMHLDATRVCFAHDYGERIVAWIQALMARQLRRPGRERRCIQRVAAQPHVKDDCVESDRPRPIEERDQLALLLLRRQSGARRPVTIGRGAQPGAPELPRDYRREHRAVAERDPGHVARRTLRDDALSARTPRVAKEEPGRGGDGGRPTSNPTGEHGEQRQARRHFLDRRILRATPSGEIPLDQARCRGHAYQTTGSELRSARQSVVSPDSSAGRRDSRRNRAAGVLVRRPRGSVWETLRSDRRIGSSRVSRGTSTGAELARIPLSRTLCPDT